MWSRLKLVTPPAVAVTTAEAKQHLRVDFSEDDTLIASLVAAATKMIEGPYGAGLAVMTQTWDLTLDGFPTSSAYLESQIFSPQGVNSGTRNSIEIPLGPVAGITQITYVDGAGNTQVLAGAGYQLDTGREPARVTPAFGLSWPVARQQNGAVVVRFVAGEAAANPIIKAAILLLVGHWYENREAVVLDGAPAELPLAVMSILNQFTRGMVA